MWEICRNLPSRLVAGIWRHWVIRIVCSQSWKERVKRLAEFFGVLPYLYQQLKIAHGWKWSQWRSQKCSYLGEYKASQHWLRVHSVFSTVCTFQLTRPILYTLHFPQNLSFCLLPQVCYTADCNVFPLRRSSCSSTVFVPPVKMVHIWTRILYHCQTTV